MRRGTAGRAFSLIEILVAAAVLAILLLIVAGLVNNTAILTTVSNRRLSADSEGRQLLDRISSDLHRAILRDDLPQRIVKSSGNDGITFYAQSDGYSGDRGISRLSYGIVNDRILRGAEGTYWSGSPEQNVAFQSPDLPSVADMESENMAQGVFRLELAFLMRDGTIKASVPSLTGKTPATQVAAVIVSIAVLDPAVRTKTDVSLSALAAAFPDAQDGRNPAELWTEAMNGPSFGPDAPVCPPPVREALRIYQRHCFLEN